MKKTHTLAKALSLIPKGKGIDAARAFLETDISQLRTDEQFHEAFKGLHACYGLLGPQSMGYRQTLDGMRKLLKQQQRLVCDLPPEQFYRDLESTWRECLELFKPHVPADIWELVGEKTEGLWRRE